MAEKDKKLLTKQTDNNTQRKFTYKRSEIVSIKTGHAAKHEQSIKYIYYIYYVYMLYIYVNCFC